MAADALSRSGRNLRWSLLGLTGAPLLGAYAYNLGYQLPGLVCPIRQWTGIPCPTCGMTRSFMAIVQGDLQQAVHHHLFGPVLFLIFLIATVHISLELFRQRRLQPFYSSWIKRRQLVFTSLGLYLLYYGLRLQHLYCTGALAVAWQQAPLSHFF